MIKREMAIYIAIALLALGGGAVFTGMSVTNPMLLRFDVGAGMTILVISAVILFLLWRTTPREAAPTSIVVSGNVPLAKHDAARDFLPANVTIAELKAITVGRTDVQKTAISKPYIDKWLRVNGYVREVKEATREAWMLFVEGKVDVQEPPIAAVFNNKWFTQLSALNIGDRVTIVGQLGNMNHGLTLRNAEIEYIGPRGNQDQ